MALPTLAGPRFASLAGLNLQLKQPVQIASRAALKASILIETQVADICKQMHGLMSFLL
jgi:hypothetical protein